MDALIIEGIDISHWRLVDLTQLADQAKPFYDWVEAQSQLKLNTSASLNSILQLSTRPEIEALIRACYFPETNVDLPLLFDGIGRNYPHTKACYYFFSWLIRDAPQQRLTPIISRIGKISGKSRLETEPLILSTLLVAYRSHVKTFVWEAIREVILDRLEGSRRSIKGHEKEAIVRTAILTALQNYYRLHENYGIYAGVEIPETQIMVGHESYDVAVNLLNPNQEVMRKILVPIKTRETEGGGHAHLFSRDIWAGLESARHDPTSILIVVIIAQNWSSRETETIKAFVDYLIVFPTSPSKFHEFTEIEQARLNVFIAQILEGKQVK